MTPGAQFFRDFVALCAVIVGMAMAAWRSYSLYKQAGAANEQAKVANEQAKTAAKRLLNEQFSDAVKLMAKETSGKKPKPAIAARIGGIYIMADLAIKKPKEFAERVVKNLIAYIKDNAQLTAQLTLKIGEKTTKLSMLGGDVKAAFSVLNDILGNEEIKKRVHDKFLDFSYQNFSGLYFEGIDMQHYKEWEGANLSRCYLVGVHFSDESNMTRTNFSGAFMMRVILKGANLFSADLRGANLQGASMQGCYMRFARLQPVRDGEYTEMVYAQLAGANLENANMSGANVFGADLRGTVLGHANLTEAQELSHTRIGETYMVKAEIDGHDKSRLSELAKSESRKLWLDDNRSDDTNWQLDKYEDGYALAGVLMNFAGAPLIGNAKFEIKQGYLPGEIINIQRQAAKLEKTPKNTPEEIKVWLEKIKAEYSKQAV
ncbi:MAG: pentapeptide repeat-containing protein [Gammaproteobacteria bacterium]